MDKIKAYRKIAFVQTRFNTHLPVLEKFDIEIACSRCASAHRLDFLFCKAPKRFGQALLRIALALGNLIRPAGSFARPRARGRHRDQAINRPYVAPDWGQWVGTFVRHGREVYDRRHEIIAPRSGCGPRCIGDVDAGTWLFTRLIARKIRGA